jgi:hypothetical protein
VAAGYWVIPTVGEFMPGFEASAFFGVGAPKGTPVEIIDKLNKEINHPFGPRGAVSDDECNKNNRDVSNSERC